MSEKEKEDMYQAIGYSENEKITDMSGFDKSYVGLELKVELNRVRYDLKPCHCLLTYFEAYSV